MSRRYPHAPIRPSTSWRPIRFATIEPLRPNKKREPLSQQEAPLVHTDRLELMWLDQTALAALLDSARVSERRGPATIPDEWVADCGGLLALRLEQIQRDPAQGPWLTRAILLKSTGAAIGQIGFHGPGVNGLQADDALELGYGILPAFRGQGFATEAARGLMHWASTKRGALRFLTSVGPSNRASIRAVEKLGFLEVARVWDDDTARRSSTSGGFPNGRRKPPVSSPTDPCGVGSVGDSNRTASRWRKPMNKAEMIGEGVNGWNAAPAITGGRSGPS